VGLTVGAGGQSFDPVLNFRVAHLSRRATGGGFCLWLVANEFVGRGTEEKSTPRPFKTERVGHPEKLNQSLSVDVLQWHYSIVAVRQLKKAKGSATRLMGFRYKRAARLKAAHGLPRM
jgi:hypothetical protein